MNVWFQHLTERISVVQDDATADAVLAELTTLAGFRSFAYVSLQAATQKVITNYAPDWVAIYNRKSYIRIDPVMKGLRDRIEAFRWVYPSDTRARARKTYFDEAARFGIRSGVTIPINPGFGNVAMLTLACDDPAFSDSKILNPVIAAAAVGQMHAHLDHLNPTPALKVSASLNAKQLLCLRWHAEGKTGRDIAVLIDDTYGNVRYYLTGAKKALGVMTLGQAVRTAMSLGLL